MTTFHMEVAANNQTTNTVSLTVNTFKTARIDLDGRTATDGYGKDASDQSKMRTMHHGEMQGYIRGHMSSSIAVIK